MRIDLQDGLPDDWHVPPSAQGDGFPDDWHVPASAQGNGFPDDWHVPPSAQGDGFPDDWHVPPSAQGNGLPNDWHVPPSAAPGLSQAAPSAEPGTTGFIPVNRSPSPDPQPNAPPFAASNLIGGATTPPPKSDDASAYSMLLGGQLPTKSDASDAPSPTPAPNGPYSATLLPALDNLDQSPLGPRRLLVSSEGGDREDDERRKFETPEVIGGLSEPGLWSPKQPPRLPSIPPLDVPPDGAERSAVTDAWGLPPTRRGRALEPLFGHNLHPNNPTVDIWDRRSGTVTSLKSIDLGSSAYQESNALYNKLSGYVNDLTDFEGSWYGDIFIPGEEIKSRVLTVIVPSEGSSTQQEAMRRIIELGARRGVTVNFKINP